ncbi:hypothetical protein [Massilia eburnea]|uniref:hypothetical protein n=1 Tax=Massilia eburnea TaxID=1776165 RepID=UPI003D6BC7FA
MLAHFRIGAGAQRALHVADDAGGLVGVSLAHQGAHQVHMVLRIAELGIAGLGHDLAESLLRRGDIARAIGHLAKVAQAAHHVRRHGNRVFQDLLGLLRLPHGLV